jgi:predicted MPP superfamily phosphohydrolase
LLSHHPEYYPKYIKELTIDLTLSGHAHGGQWCFFGRGVYAPGQGILPKYTHGMHDGKFIVSRGLSILNPIPRINNKPEIIVIQLEPQN